MRKKKKNFIYNLVLITIAVSATGLFLFNIIEDSSKLSASNNSKNFITVGNWKWAVYSDTHEGGTSSINMKILEDEEQIIISGHIDDLSEAAKPMKQFLSFSKKPNDNEKAYSARKQMPFSYAVAEVMPNNAALESLISANPNSFSFWVKGDGLPYKIVVKTTGDYGNESHYWVSRVFPKSAEKITIPYIELAPHHASIDQTAIKSISFHATTEFIKEEYGSDFSFTLWWDKTSHEDPYVSSAEHFMHNID